MLVSVLGLGEEGKTGEFVDGSTGCEVVGGEEHSREGRRVSRHRLEGGSANRLRQLSGAV